MGDKTWGGEKNKKIKFLKWPTPCGIPKPSHQKLREKTHNHAGELTLMLNAAEYYFGC